MKTILIESLGMGQTTVSAIIWEIILWRNYIVFYLAILMGCCDEGRNTVQVSYIIT